MSSQSKQSIEQWYEQNDPWGYEQHPDDQIRKGLILGVLAEYPKFVRALDIGCGQGFITESLPARHIEGIEISDKAAERLSSNVNRVAKPDGQYDLVVCTGMLYNHYDYRQFISWIETCSSGIVLTCNIKDWERAQPALTQLFSQEFPYREFTQVLRVFKV